MKIMFLSSYKQGLCKSKVLKSIDQVSLVCASATKRRKKNDYQYFVRQRFLFILSAQHTQKFLIVALRDLR